MTTTTLLPDHTADPEYLALLAAVLAKPEDDLARLMYADWIEEHGKAERAEFIRLQIAMAGDLRNARCDTRLRELCDELDLLINNDGRVWRDSMSHEEYTRGFVSSCVVPQAAVSCGCSPHDEGLSCEDCRGCGWKTVTASYVFLRDPIEWVVPVQYIFGGEIGWPVSYLGYGLHRMMTPKRYRTDTSSIPYVTYHNTRRAIRTFSTSYVRLARKQCGLRKRRLTA